MREGRIDGWKDIQISQPTRRADRKINDRPTEKDVQTDRAIDMKTNGRTDIQTKWTGMHTMARKLTICSFTQVEDAVQNLPLTNVFQAHFLKGLIHIAFQVEVRLHSADWPGVSRQVEFILWDRQMERRAAA